MTIDDKGKKGFIKFSMKDSQNSFIIISPTAMEMECTLKRISEKEAIQHCILVVGFVRPKTYFIMS